MDLREFKERLFALGSGWIGGHGDLCSACQGTGSEDFKSEVDDYSLATS